MAEAMIHFRKLNEEDLPLLFQWLNKDHVKEWYTKNRITYERVQEKYTPYILGEKPTIAYIILIEDTPIGYIQTYKIEDYPSYSLLIEIKEKAAGLDLFIGEEEYLHRALGHKIIKRFLQEVVYRMEEVECCIIGPEPENKIAIKAYEKAGFSYVKTIFNPNENGYEYIMKHLKEK